MDSLRQDIRFAYRRLVRSPSFTLIAVLSLALGIGANTAIFSMVNAVLLREPALEDPEELYEIYLRQPGFSHGALSYPDYVDVRDHMDDVFEGVATSRLALLPAEAGDGSVEMLPTEFVSGNYFELQGVGATVGRTLLPEDDVARGGHPVVALSWEYWQTRYEGDPDVIGQSVRIGGRELTITGVVEPSYTGTLRGLVPDIFAPVMMVDELDPSNAGQLEGRSYQSFFPRARIRAGTSPAEVAAATARMTAWLHDTWPDEWQGDEALVIMPTRDVVVNPMIDRVLVPALGLLMGVVGIVLLIACANLAGFLLARATDRRREMAVRLALGAGRLSLIRQLITETTMLAILGGAAGVGLAVWLTGVFETAPLPLPIPIDLGLEIDGTVLLFTAGVSLAAGLLFGLAPALESTNPSLVRTIRASSTGGPPKRFGMRNLLVIGQVAFSLVLLIGAGLLLRSMQARQAIDPGFGYTPAALVSISTGMGETAEENRLVLEDIAERARQLPGVQAVGMTTNLHLNTLSTNTRSVTVEGIAPPAGRDYWEVDYASVTPGFFEAVGLRLRSGRLFTDGDRSGTQPVVVVNQAFVDRFFPEKDAIGRIVQLSTGDHVVVGIVNTAKIRSLGETPRPYLYQPFAQGTPDYSTIVVQSRRDPRVTVLEIARAGREIDPDLRIYETRTMDAHIATVLLPARLSAVVSAVFAGLALLLAAIGLYGVVSYAVARRTREVGIRISLGAHSGEVVRMLMGEGLRLVMVGSVAGLGLSVLFALALSRFLYGIAAFDVAAFAGTALLLVCIAMLATWLPARRATRVSPTQALRTE